MACFGPSAWKERGPNCHFLACAMGESGKPEDVGLVCRRWLAAHGTAVCYARELMVPNLTRLQDLFLIFDSCRSFEL